MRHMTALVAIVAVLLAACGDSRVPIETDLQAATEIIQGPAAVMEPVGRDEYGFVRSQEPTLDAFTVATDTVARFGTFADPAIRTQLSFVRNPVSRGPLGRVLDTSEFVIVIMIPLLDPTRALGIGFDAAFIGLDADGNVVASDFDAATDTRLQALFDEGRSRGMSPAEILASAAIGLNGGTITGLQSDAATLLKDG